MKTLAFEGSSDDTFGEVEVTREAQDNCGSGEPIRYRVQLASGAGVMVTGQYKGCWMIGVESLDEDKPVDWPMRIFPCWGGYCNRLEIDVPDETLLVEVPED